jgi:hypothetical protein
VTLSRESVWFSVQNKVAISKKLKATVLRITGNI